MNLSFDLLTTTIKQVLIEYKNLLQKHNYSFPNGDKEYIILQQNLENTSLKITIIIDYQSCLIYSTDTTGVINFYFLNQNISYKAMNYIVQTIIEDLQKTQQEHVDIAQDINQLIKKILKVEFLFNQYMMNQKY